MSEMPGNEQLKEQMFRNTDNATRIFLDRQEDNEDECGPDCPKSKVSWEQTINFANQLSVLEGLDQCYFNDEEQDDQLTWNESCNGWRLPTDEEWASAAYHEQRKNPPAPAPSNLAPYTPHSIISLYI